MNKVLKKGFTLVELLVVISIIAVLTGILAPALNSARNQARKIVCRSNIHQLAIANMIYATNNDSSYVPAAYDMLERSRSANTHRWHGVRENINQPFDPSKGPLAAFLGDGKIKECPQRTDFRKGHEWDYNFEQGCGGYGYNLNYIGSRIWQQDQSDESYKTTTKTFEVKKPYQTLMFADTAFLQYDSIIEYSFAEPKFLASMGKVFTGSSTTKKPSLHFRHNKSTNIAWCDGHVSSLSLAEDIETDSYLQKCANNNIGWFEPLDNSLFDLK